MIIKIWRYKVAGYEAGRPRTRQTSAFDLVYGCGAYIARRVQTEAQRETFENAELIGEFAPDAVRAGDYLTGHDDRDDFLGATSHNLDSETIEEQIGEMAEIAASAGLEHFYHYTWSHRPGEVFTFREMREQNRTIRRILNASACPAIEAHHGETDDCSAKEPHGHGHTILMSIDENGKGQPLANGWYKEAAQIAIAVAERDFGLRPEPMRRYIATERGVENFLTGDVVADRTGRILPSKNPDRVDADGVPLPDGGLMSRVRRKHDAIIAANEAPEGCEPGQEWSLETYARVVIAPRIQAANGWQETHRFLAPLGVRYVKVGNTGRLEAIGPGGAPTGKWVAAGAAYSNAGLGKLMKRFKNEEYIPPPTDLDFRPLTMPVYNRAEPEEAQREEAERVRVTEIAALKSEAKKVEAHIASVDKQRRNAIREAKLGAGYNDAVAQQAALHREEKQLVHDFLVSKGAQRVRKDGKRAKDKPADRKLWSKVRCLLWGPLRSREKDQKRKRRAELEKRYRIKSSGRGLEYRLHSTPDTEPADFIETDALVCVQSPVRRVNIDALRVAEDKFATLRVTGTQRAIGDTIKVAAELGLTLLDEQAEAAKLHVGAVQVRETRSLLEVSRVFYELLPKRQRARQEAKRDEQSRRARITEINQAGHPFHLQALLARYLADPSRTVAGGDDSELLEGRRKLKEDISYDHLLLASSRYRRNFAGHEYRFIDEPSLQKVFVNNPEMLVDQDVQLTLRAAEAIQLDKRRWIAGAVASGTATIKDGGLEIAGKDAKWARDFWKAQGSDPTFRRLITVARARPERFPFAAALRPGEATLRALAEPRHAALRARIGQLLAHHDPEFWRDESAGESVPKDSPKAKVESALPDLDHSAPPSKSSPSITQPSGRNTPREVGRGLSPSHDQGPQR